jgi:hypothetical protein
MAPQKLPTSAAELLTNEVLVTEIGTLLPE